MKAGVEDWVVVVVEATVVVVVVGAAVVVVVGAAVVVVRTAVVVVVAVVEAPVPLRNAVADCVVSEKLKLTSELNAPEAVGVNFTPMKQLLPTAIVPLQVVEPTEKPVAGGIPADPDSVRTPVPVFLTSNNFSDEVVFTFTDPKLQFDGVILTV